MKRASKTISLLLAVLMAAAMCLPVFAAEGQEDPYAKLKEGVATVNETIEHFSDPKVREDIGEEAAEQIKAHAEALKAEGIPVLCIETDYTDTDAEQLRTGYAGAIGAALAAKAIRKEAVRS